VSESGEDFMARVLAEEVKAPVYVTPWGRAQSLDVPTMRAIQQGRRAVTWAERWVIARDMAEANGCEPGEAAMVATAETMRERAATAHERVACPRCGAGVGVRCRRVNSISALSLAPLKHSHAERLRADGIAER
jgi:hypothetical protein